MRTKKEKMPVGRVENRFQKGFSDGIPICLGYLSVSFAFGMTAVQSGLPILWTVLVSMTNLTSAGQVAGVPILLAGGSAVEMALTQFVINLRYALMSISLSQKLHNVSVADRFAIGFGITDEIFAVSVSKPCEIGKRYMAGLILSPYLGWTAGTIIGAAAGSLLPASVRSALGIALYAMFIAIIIPPAKKSRAVAAVVVIAAAFSCTFAYVPFMKALFAGSSGFVIIICAVVSAVIGALVWPIWEAGGDGEEKTPDGKEETA